MSPHKQLLIYGVFILNKQKNTSIWVSWRTKLSKVGFSRGFFHFPMPVISFYDFSTLISFILFHLNSPTLMIVRQAWSIGTELHRTSSLDAALCRTRVEKYRNLKSFLRFTRSTEITWHIPKWGSLWYPERKLGPTSFKKANITLFTKWGVLFFTLDIIQGFNPKSKIPQNTVFLRYP